MTAAGPLPLPDLGTITAWRRQFASLQPRALLFGRLDIVVIEAAVVVRRSARADNLCRTLLHAIPDTAEIALRDAAAIDPALLDGSIAELLRAGLIDTRDARRFALTRAGREARDNGAWTVPTVERRTFAFLDLRPAAAPQFVDAGRWPLQPATSDIRPCDAVGLEAVRDAVACDAGWKREHGFPESVEAVASLEEVDDREKWRRIPVVRCYHLTAVAVGLEDGGSAAWQIHAVKPGSWIVAGGEPIVILPAGALPAIPGDAIRLSWRTWCQERGMTPDETDSFAWETDGLGVAFILPIEGSAALRNAREELKKGETWLTADAGAWRRTFLASAR